MSRITDFVELYRRLGVRPGCSIDEFRLAYRRHVAELHPDRTGEPSLQQLARLQHLNAMYGAAIDFHRQHGRLPGTIQRRAPPLRPQPAPEAAAELAPRPTHARRLLMAGGLCAVLAILWSARPGQERPSSGEMDYPSAAPKPATAVAPSAPAPAALHIGSSAQEVVLVEGRPIMSGNGRWEYGPSWIRMEDGHVVDWYSSPLHPLHIAHDEAPGP